MGRLQLGRWCVHRKVLSKVCGCNSSDGRPQPSSTGGGERRGPRGLGCHSCSGRRTQLSLPGLGSKGKRLALNGRGLEEGPCRGMLPSQGSVRLVLGAWKTANEPHCWDQPLPPGQSCVAVVSLTGRATSPFSPPALPSPSQDAFRSFPAPAAQGSLGGLGLRVNSRSATFVAAPYP